MELGHYRVIMLLILSVAILGFIVATVNHVRICYKLKKQIKEASKF